MIELPREIISDIIGYFRNYEDEEYKGLGVGSKDIEVHRRIYERYIRKRKEIEKEMKKGMKWNEKINFSVLEKKLDKNMEKMYGKTKRKYGFNEINHKEIWDKMRKHSSYKKEKRDEWMEMYFMLYNRIERAKEM